MRPRRRIASLPHTANAALFGQPIRSALLVDSFYGRMVDTLSWLGRYPKV